MNKSVIILGFFKHIVTFPSICCSSSALPPSLLFLLLPPQFFKNVHVILRLPASQSLIYCPVAGGPMQEIRKESSLSRIRSKAAASIGNVVILVPLASSMTLRNYLAFMG